jgi:hypothetical protein
MSSLTYHAEHLAWQQRVNQEKSRATNFYRTTGGFPAYDLSTLNDRPIFPNATVDENPINYRTLKHNLAYTFGGTKNIKSSWQDSPEGRSYSKSPQKLRNIVREASIEARPLRQLNDELTLLKRRCGYGKNVESSMAYIKELEERLITERKKRMKAESKLADR